MQQQEDSKGQATISLRVNAKVGHLGAHIWDFKFTKYIPITAKQLHFHDSFEKKPVKIIRIATQLRYVRDEFSFFVCTQNFHYFGF